MNYERLGSKSITSFMREARGHTFSPSSKRLTDFSSLKQRAFFGFKTREIIKLQLKLLITERHLIIITGWFYDSMMLK